MDPELLIRQMTRSEVGDLVAWAAAEGWNPGLHDADLFWATDPEAFIAAEIDGQLIGGGAITAYQDAFGFMGFFIVRPAYRGRGLGNRLWHARRERLIARLTPGATIGMDGVFAMQDYYAKGGFVFSHRDIRFRADLTAAPISAADLALTTPSASLALTTPAADLAAPTSSSRLAETNSSSDLAEKTVTSDIGAQIPAAHLAWTSDAATAPGEIVALSDVPFDEVLAYDRDCFPAPRPTFLRGWISQPESLALGYRRQGRLSGMGVARRCGEGFKIGPLFADDLQVAETLFGRLARVAAGGPIFLDTPENNPAAMELARRQGMREVFGCARMYLGPAPALAHHRIFGVTTFELG